MKQVLLKSMVWLVAMGLLVVVGSNVSLAEAWAALGALQWQQILILIGVNGAVLLGLNGRWWLILRAQGYRIPYLTLTGYRLAAFGLSYFTPGPQFGGEPLQVVLVERHHHVPRTTAIAAVTLDKSLELLVNFSFLVAGVALVLRARLFPGTVGLEAVAFALTLLALPVGFLITIASGRHPISKLLQMGRRLSLLQARPVWLARYHSAWQAVRASETQAAALFRNAPFALVLAFLASLVSWVIMVGEYGLMLSFLGLSLTPVEIIAALTAARIAILLPLPAGLGTLEASQALALSALGLNPAVGISATLLIRGRDVTVGGLGLLLGSSRWLRTAGKYIKVESKVSAR